MNKTIKLILFIILGYCIFLFSRYYSKEYGVSNQRQNVERRKSSKIEDILLSNHEYLHYICNTDSIEKIGGRVDIEYQGDLNPYYKYGIYINDFIKIYEKNCIDNHIVDAGYSALLSSDDKVYGIAKTLTGDYIYDERVPADYAKLFYNLQDSLTTVYGKPYYTLTTDTCLLCVWTYKGLVNVLYGYDKYRETRDYVHFPQVLLAKYNPKVLFEKYKKLSYINDYRETSSSIVELSFHGILLGGSCNNQISKALKNKDIKGGFWEGNCFVSNSIIYSPQGDFDVDVELYERNDTIYKILLFSSDKRLHDVYEERYKNTRYFKNMHIEYKTHNSSKDGFVGIRSKLRPGFAKKYVYHSDPSRYELGIKEVTYIHDSIVNVIEKEKILEQRRQNRERVEEENQRRLENERKTQEQDI